MVIARASRPNKQREPKVDTHAADLVWNESTLYSTYVAQGTRDR
jgi:hypothetical protein